MAALYKADIHYPYQVASLKMGTRQRGLHMYDTLELPNSEFIYMAKLMPLRGAMEKEHVHFGEWEAFQDVLLQAQPEDFSPEMQWMKENFPELAELHGAFLESRQGQEALADYRQAFVNFAAGNGIYLPEEPRDEYSFGR